MTDFLRNNRYASVIITTVILIVIGSIVGVTREDSPGSTGVVLRADERSLQSPTSVSIPGAVQRPTATVPTPIAGQPPQFTVPGNVAKPAGGNRAGGGTTRPTTTTPGAPAPTTTTPAPAGSAFAAGRIAYSHAGGVWTVNPDGSDARSVALNAYFPAFAPDHSVIAFADADSPGGALFLLTPSGERIGVTTGVVDDAQPSWAPDGSKLAFARLDTTTDSDYSAIWIVNRDGSNLRKLATPSPCFSRDPAWSPDGKKIAFWSSRDHCSGGPTQGDYTLYLYDFVSNKTTALGDAKTNRGAPAWSPDGKTIAFSSDGDGGVGFEICVMNADGTNVRRLTNVSGDDTDPSFSPDGKKIVFRSERNGGGLFVMNADGSSPTMIVGGAAQPDWG